MKILGDRRIEELGQIFESDPTELEALLRTINFSSYIFKLRARMEHFNDDTRIRTGVVGVAPINYKEYGTHLLEEIRKG